MASASACVHWCIGINWRKKSLRPALVDHHHTCNKNQKQDLVGLQIQSTFRDLPPHRSYTICRQPSTRCFRHRWCCNPIQDFFCYLAGSDTGVLHAKVCKSKHNEINAIHVRGFGIDEAMCWLEFLA